MPTWFLAPIEGLIPTLTTEYLTSVLYEYVTLTTGYNIGDSFTSRWLQKKASNGNLMKEYGGIGFWIFFYMCYYRWLLANDI